MYRFNGVSSFQVPKRGKSTMTVRATTREDMQLKEERVDGEHVRRRNIPHVTRSSFVPDLRIS